MAVKKILKNIGMYLCVQVGAFIIIGLPLVFKGPFQNIKENWVLTAMTTMNHQYLATMFVDSNEVNEIIQKHQTPDSTEKTDLDDIKINEVENIEEEYSYPGATTVYDDDGIKVESFREGKFKAYVTIIDDPSRVKVATTKNLGNSGEKLISMTDRYKAVVGINAGGFADDGGHGDGGTPLGFVIEDGEMIYSQSDSNHPVVGFNKDDKLVIGYYNSDEIEALNLRDAITFRPFLIINGKPQITEGNGGWGIAPRTAIGQRRDGKVIFVTIDGRQTSSVGATLREVQDIMLAYGAYNCANLDGGSSSQLVLNKKTINSPSSSAGPRSLSTAFIVK